MADRLVPETEPYMTDDVPLDDVRENALRPLVYICLLLAGALVAMGFVVRVPEYVKARVVLQGDVPEVEYQFPETVFVEEVCIDAGDSVQKGDQLVRITSPDIVSRIAELREVTERLAQFRREQSVIHEANLSRNQLERKRIEDRLGENRRTLQTENDTYAQRHAALKFDVDEADKQVERNRAMVEQGFVSRTRFTELQQVANRAREELAKASQEHRNEVNRLEGLIRGLQLDLEKLELESSQLVREYRQREGEHVQARDRIVDKIRHQYRDAVIVDGSLMLTAPVAGTVSYLRTSERNVGAGETLIKIMGREEGLHGLAIADASQLGRLSQGQSAILKMDSFPHYRFGVVNGTIRTVSLSPDSEGRLPFTVQIEDAGLLDGRLQVGMTGRVSVVVAEQRFFSMLFHKVAQQLDN